MQKDINSPDLLKIAYNVEKFWERIFVCMWCETHTYAYLATFKCTLMLYYLFLVYRENINLKLFSQTPDTSL